MTETPIWLVFLLLAGAGAGGGAIRWWSITSKVPIWWLAPASYASLFGDCVTGAIAGTMLHGLGFAIVKPIADLTSMDPLDAKLLGAHIAGLLGLTLYTILWDGFATFRRVLKASMTEKEPTP